MAGFFPPTGSSFDPVTDPYPTSNPSGWTVQAEDFAGTLIGEPPGGGAEVTLTLPLSSIALDDEPKEQRNKEAN